VEELVSLLLTSGPDQRHPVKQVRQFGSEVAPVVTTMGAAAQRRLRFDHSFGAGVVRHCIRGSRSQIPNAVAADALAVRRRRQGTVKVRAVAASPSLTAPKQNENLASDRLPGPQFCQVYARNARKSLAEIVF
jgi:hypothetical protein